jgi:hypothetical protein
MKSRPRGAQGILVPALRSNRLFDDDLTLAELREWHKKFRHLRFQANLRVQRKEIASEATAEADRYP